MRGGLSEVQVGTEEGAKRTAFAPRANTCSRTDKYCYNAAVRRSTVGEVGAVD